MKELRIYKPQVSHCILYMHKSYLVYIQSWARKSSENENYWINQGERVSAENLFQVTIERWEIQFVQLFTWYLIVLVKHDVNMKISASYCYITFYLCRGKYSHVLYKIIFFEKLKENNYRRVPFRVKLQKRFKVFITFTMYLLFHKQGFYSQRRFSVA